MNRRRSQGLSAAVATLAVLGLVAAGTGSAGAAGKPDGTAVSTVQRDAGTVPGGSPGNLDSMNNGIGLFILR